MGDLNFRVQHPYEETIELLNGINDENKQETIQFLFNRDQLSLLTNDFPWLKEYKEMKVDFLPTYKYDKESDIYDTSDKMRVPSWCDRILWREKDGENEEIENYWIPVSYERRESLFSDHRPVIAKFKVYTDKYSTAWGEEDEWDQKFDTTRKFPSYDPDKNKSISKQLDTEDINPFKHSKTREESELD